MSVPHILDNPIWHALTTSQASLAQGDTFARRFPTDIAPFGAVAEESEEAFSHLTDVIPSGEMVVLMRDYPKQAEWKLLREFAVNQMVYEGPIIAPPQPSCEITTLTHDDVPLMLKLVDLTHPGPFLPRTIELGQYISIWQDGQLAAMAGERFHGTGYHEISAVCTYPDFQKRGYARQLILQLIHKIQNEGETPFLHVVPENVGAIALYESMGFKCRTQLPLFVIKRQ